MAIRRIAGQHWRLILCFVVVPVALIAVSHLGAPARYTAAARVVLDTQDPKSRSEAGVIADTAKAIATSPLVVEEALAAAHITGRDPERIARQDVSVQSLGSSAVLELAVTDRSGAAAASLANALAAKVISTRLEITSGEFERLLSGLDAQIAELSGKIKAEETNGRATGPLRAFLVERRSMLEAQRGNLLASDALRPKPAIISRASTPTAADPSRTFPDVVLAALLGLVAGLALASLIESVRPTFVGGGPLADEFDTPFVGEISIHAADAGPHEWSGAAMRLALAAEASGVRDVLLVAAGPPVDLDEVAVRLQEQIDEMSAEAVDEQAVAATGGGGSRAELRAATGVSDDRRRRARPAAVPSAPLTVRSLHAGAPLAAVRSGVLVIAPRTLRRTDIVETSHLLRTIGAPRLGLATYRQAPLARGVGRLSFVVTALRQHAGRLRTGRRAAR